MEPALALGEWGMQVSLDERKDDIDLGDLRDLARDRVIFTLNSYRTLDALNNLNDPKLGRLAALNFREGDLSDEGKRYQITLGVQDAVRGFFDETEYSAAKKKLMDAIDLAAARKAAVMAALDPGKSAAKIKAILNPEWRQPEGSKDR